MNPEQLLQSVATLIENRDAQDGRRFHICFFENQFRCLPVNHTGKAHPVFLAGTNEEFRDGLNNHQWDNLLHKLVLFQKRQRK